MGQKTHPLGFRLGVIKTWRSRWYAGKNYAEMLHEDLRLRRYIKERLHHSGVSRIEIERKADQIRIIYKRELDVIPFFGWGLRYGSYIGIDRGRGSRAVKSLEEAVEKIRSGASVLMYAEGTRTLDGKLQPFKRGAFNLALRAGIPVVPLTVNGSFAILPKHSVSVRPGTVELVLGAPIPVPGGGGKDAELQLMQEVHAVIAGHYIDQG